MSFLLQPWQILLAALCGMVNQRQQPIIEFVNVQIDALLKKLGKKQERISAAKMKDGTSVRLTAAKERASNKRKHQRPAASVLPEEDQFPRHLTPCPCTCNEPAQQSSPKETELAHHNWLTTNPTLHFRCKSTPQFSHPGQYCRVHSCFPGTTTFMIAEQSHGKKARSDIMSNRARV